MKQAYLKNIKVGEGQFSNENAITLVDYNGTPTSGFFNSKFIKNAGLEVQVVDETEDLALIKIPGRMLEMPGDKGYLTVKKSDLEYDLGSIC